MAEPRDFFAAVAEIYEFEALDVEALRKVYRVERVGETFYEKLAAKLENPDAADLLLRNAREERGHAERVRRAIGKKLGRDYEPAGADLETLPIPLPEKITPELFEGIVAGEIAGSGYRSGPTAARSRGPKLLRQNGREEIVHSERAARVLALLRAP
jgi:rubrerythrin